jgi:hypothetical protein
LTKLSVSLTPADVAFIDSIAVRYDGNRSAAIHDLVRLGRELAAAAVADVRVAPLEGVAAGDDRRPCGRGMPCGGEDLARRLLGDLVRTGNLIQPVRSVRSRSTADHG